MAKQRRTGGSGFRTPELRGTLGTLVRTTLQQAGALRDAIERGAREGRSRLDEARSARRRTEALAELGEIVLDLIRRDEIDLSELPEAADLVRFLDELDADAHSDHDDDDDERRYAKPAARSRFDTRRPSRPPPIETDADDGTVSAIGTNPPARARPRPPQQPAARVWRPPADEEDQPKASSPPSRDPNRKGGIRFDTDDDDCDLADYMHPDDVPPKPPADGEP
jgi:hypothetical protein